MPAAPCRAGRRGSAPRRWADVVRRRTVAPGSNAGRTAVEGIDHLGGAARSAAATAATPEAPRRDHPRSRLPPPALQAPDRPGEHRPRDHHALHLARALADLAQLRVAHVALDRIVAHVAVAA